MVNICNRLKFPTEHFNINSFFVFTDKTVRMLFQNANPKSAEKRLTSNNNNNNDIEMNTVQEEQVQQQQQQQPLTKWQQFGENICLKGDGQINYIDAKAKLPSEEVLRRCGFCAKPSSIQATDCVNCNLEICEFCGISCLQCNAPLCMSCVQLLYVLLILILPFIYLLLLTVRCILNQLISFLLNFSGCCDNSVDMNACCERCKQIYNIH